MEMGQWVMVTALDPLTHEEEVNVQWLAKIASQCNFFVLS